MVVGIKNPRSARVVRVAVMLQLPVEAEANGVLIHA